MPYKKNFNSRVYLALMIVLFSFNFLHAQSHVETGVSYSLAQERKKIISNIEYLIHFQIPDTISQSIMANEIIHFDAQPFNADLQIDFLENKNHCLKIIVNQKTIPIQLLNEHIIIPKSNLKKGANIIEINFIAGELALNRSADYLYTLLVPEKARTFIPCFDQPDLKARFTVSATVPKEWIAVSNGSTVSKIMHQNNTEYSFAKSDLMPTYLFSFIAGKFQVATQQIDGKTVNFYFRETDTAKLSMNIDSIFELNRIAIHFMEKYTGIKYPFQKFDFVAIPFFQFGGMEHVGCIDYRASSLFLEKTATLNDKIIRAQLIGHEVSHMWFGDLVTMKWFNDVWMKEVFANFMADKILLSIYPNFNKKYQSFLTHQPAAYSVDRTLGSNPIRQELQNLDQAGSLYGNIIYDKAPIVVNQLETSIGESNMQKGLQIYLNKYAFNNADWPELISILDKYSKESLTTWNQKWINEIGRPVINYKYVQNKKGDKIISLTQHGENHLKGLWNQYFSVTFFYDTNMITLPVKMNAASVQINTNCSEKPLFTVFNSEGEGYGSFPIDPAMLTQMKKITNPLMRASALMNVYDNVIDGKIISPKNYILFCLSVLKEEKEELIINKLIGQFYTIFYQYLLPTERDSLIGQVEETLWSCIHSNSNVAIKSQFFNAYSSMLTSKTGLDKLYAIWKYKEEIEHIPFAESDYTNMAKKLAIKNHPLSKEILAEQLSRIENKDRRESFIFTIPALSNDTTVRDSVFASFANAANRKKENWVALSLSHLNDPSRSQYSKKYLAKSLELLEEVKKTSGIFFPDAWLGTIFRYHQSATAIQIVNQFLKMHPHYNKNLKAKILQASDGIFRANKIIGKG